jgi:RNA polymerase sigma-70 factor (ECF subfamily)
MTKSREYLNIHEQLIEQCRIGSRSAQFEIYKLYYKTMFNACHRIVNNVQEAEDIMQEAFLKAFQNIKGYKGDVSFGAWLKKIVINRSIDYLRKKKIDFENIENYSGDLTDDNIEDLWEIEDKIKYNEVLKEIGNLPEGYKIIVSLYLLEGYDHFEISEILKISPSTSRSQFNRAKND